MHFNVKWRAAPMVLLLLLAVRVSAQPAYAPEAVGAAPQSPAGERPSQGARIGAELGLGVVGLVGGGLAGGLGGLLVGHVVCSSVLSDCMVQSTLAGGLIGGGLGMPMGVNWGGKLAGGNGTINGALAGSAISLALSGTAFFALKEGRLGAGLLLTLPALSVVGYELTDSDPQPAPDGAVPATVAPAVGFSAGGASFGLQGTF